MEPDHYGISLAVATEGIPDALIAGRGQRRPDADPASLVAASWPDARRDDRARTSPAGLTQVRHQASVAVSSPGRFLDQFLSEMIPLQN